MGFLAGMLDKSVFNQKTYQSAIGKSGENGYAVVRIKPNYSRLNSQTPDPAIKGVYDYSSGGLSFNIEANWTDLGQVGGAVLPTQSSTIKRAYDWVNNAASVGGISNIGAGISSQLIYQKSGYLEIKIPMMIVDWNGKGQPILSSLLLASYCLPTFVDDIKEEVEDFMKNIKEKVNEAAQDSKNPVIKLAAAATSVAIEGAESGGEFVAKFASKAPDSIKDAFNSTGKNVENNVGDLRDAYTVRSFPTSVTVEIGQFFKNDDMVIKGVDFEFSKEVTRDGPLFVKVNLSLSSRRILTGIDNIGLAPINKNSRYQEVGGNATGF